ncbi:hypothetical protein [Embleya sp. AB8]|uniref:hypothetical protein n=1 Tax=Embleya sp. AB8 TaxID=3156304 RepID=UPI003C709898
MPGPGGHVAEVAVAPVAAVDAAAMAAWINAFHWNPGPLGGAPLSAADYAAFVAERGAVETFVALAEDRVVGSLALYPVSALKAGQGAVVWMDTFAIDPRFRLGAVPIRLFVEAFAYCVAHGYDRVDCNASPANPSMVAIVRPGGFRQASTDPCGDDRLEFRSYLPYLYRFIIQALGLGARQAELARAWTDFGSSPWVPGRAPRNAADDVADYHGAATFRYPMIGSGAESTFVVDLTHDRVCALNWDGLEIDFHPATRTRRVPVGGSAGFVHRIANRGTRPITVELAVRRAGGGEAPSPRRFALSPGEAIEGETALALDHLGEHEAELTVHADVSHAGSAHPARLTLHSWVRAVAAAPAAPAPARAPRSRPRLEEREDHWLLANRWLRLIVDKATGTCEIEPARDRGPAIRELWPDLGPPFPAALKTPPRRDPARVRAIVADGRAELTLEAPANIWWRRHGAAYAATRPDLGLSRARLRRTLVVGGDQLVEVRTELIDAEPRLRRAVAARECLLRVHPWARGRALTMSVPLAEGLWRAPVVYERFPFGMHSLELLGSADLPAEPARYAERWTAFTDDGGHSVGLLWQRAEQLRYGLQWMPALLLAGEPADPEAEGVLSFPGYALFCGPGDERTVRDACAALTDPAEPMPAIERPPLAAPVPVRIGLEPTGEVDAGVETAPDTMLVRGRLTVLSARARHGRLTAAVEGGPAETLFAGDAAGDHPFAGRIVVPARRPGSVGVRVEWVEESARQSSRHDVLPVTRGAAAKPVTAVDTGDVWVLDNGELTARIAPDFGASVVGLRRPGGAELLRSTYPRPRPMGIVPRARGGLNISTVAHRADPNTSVAREEFAWTPIRTAPTHLTAAGRTWSGLRLTGEIHLAGTDLGLDVDYLMTPGASLLIVLTRGHRDGRAFDPAPDFCVAVHAAQPSPWFFRGLRQGTEFEYHATPHGSNRPIAGSAGCGALVPAEPTDPPGPGLLLAGPPDTDVLGFRDGDDWSIRALARTESSAAAGAVTATCLAVANAPRPVPAGALGRLAEALRAAAAAAH